MWFRYVNNIMVAFGILLMIQSLDILSQLELTHKGHWVNSSFKSTCFLWWILEPPKKDPKTSDFTDEILQQFLEGVEWELKMFLGPKNSQYFHIVRDGYQTQ